MTKELKHVTQFRASHLKKGESILVWCEGYIGEMMGKGDKTQHNGVLIITEQRVAFYRKGLLGEVLETIPLPKITSVERKSTMGHRTIRMHTSHDKLEFKFFDQAKESQLIDAIEDGREPLEPSASPSEPDPLEALKKLGELKEMGVITKEEFESKKADLLGKI